MKRYSHFLLLALCALALASCSEREGGSLVDVGRGTALSFAPRFTYLGSTSFAPINHIRLTARSVATHAIVATDTTSVDPNAQQWEITLDVPPNAGTVVVLIELINRVGNTETVEWSGLSAAITVEPGEESSPATPVTLFQGPPGNLTVTGVTVSPEGGTVVEGGTVQLSAAVTGGGPGASVVWASLDNGVADVDDNGLVTTLRDGNARIVAIAGPKADTVIVSATQRIASVSISPDTLFGTSIGATVVFTAHVLDPRGGEISSADVAWSSSDNAIATSLGSGAFRTNANGAAQITATSTSNAAILGTATLVVAQRAAHIALTPESANLGSVGATQQFTASLTDANGNALAGTVGWRSENSAIATVDAAGLVTAVAPGATEVSAIANAGAADSVVARAQITVAQTVAAVVVTPSDANLFAFGDTVRFHAEARDARGAVIPGVTFAWSSSNAAAVTVNQSGLATAVSNGGSSITAIANDVRGSGQVNVRQTVASIAITSTQDTLAVGSTATLSATVRDARGNTMGDAVTWTVSDTTKATVSSTGVLTARAAGSVTVTAQSGSVTGSRTIVIKPGAANVNLVAYAITTEPPDTFYEDVGGSVTIEIRNTGTAASPPTTMQAAIVLPFAPFAVVDDTIISVPAIAAGGSFIFTSQIGGDGEEEAAPDSIRLRVEVDPQHLVVESNETDNVVMTSTRYIRPAPERTWLGLSPDWNDPNNWWPAAPPTPTSAAFIPLGVPFQPVLTDNAAVRDLVMESGASLNLGAFNILVTGDLTDVTITGGVDAQVIMQGGEAARVNGSVQNLVADKTITLEGFFQVNGFAAIGPHAEVYVVNNQLRIEGTLMVNGVLDMTDAAASVVVYDDATFATTSASSVGHLTGGTLSLFSNLIVAGSPLAFSPSGDHTTVFAASGDKTIQFDTFGPEAHFANLMIDTGSRVTFLSNATVQGDVHLTAIAGIVDAAPEQSVTIGGDLIIDEGSGDWQVPLTVFEGDDVTFPTLMHGFVVFRGQTALQQNQTIEGMVAVDGGRLDLNGNTLTVGGDFVTQNGGTLLMDVGEVLNVGGSVNFAGSPNADAFLGGTINVQYDFSVTQPGAFSSEGTEVWFSTNSSSVENHVSVIQPDTSQGGNHFADLYNANGVAGIVLDSDIAVNGDIEFGVSAQRITGDGRTVTLLGDFEDPGSGLMWEVTNLILGRGDSEFPARLTTNLTYAGENHTFDRDREIHGNVIVRRGNLDMGINTLTVYGNFTTEAGGTVEMIDVEGSGRLYVHGDVAFNGGRSVLRTGTLQVGGTFSVGAPAAFQAEALHQTVMTSFNDFVAPDNISMMNPGVSDEADQNHFGTLLVGNETNLNSDIATTGSIDVSFGYHLFGADHTVTVMGDIYDNISCECAEAGPGYLRPIPGAMGDVRVAPSSKRALLRRPAARAPDRVTTAATHAKPQPHERMARPRLIGANGAIIAASSASPFGISNYNVDRTVLAGSEQYLPFYIDTDIEVVTSVFLTTDFVEIDGDLTISGINAQLILGGFDSGTEVEVDGNFSTQDGGTIHMQTSECCYNSVFVAGDVTFNGGSELGLLEYGTIGASSNFTATTSDAHSFVSDGVEVILEGDGTTQVVSMATPSTQTFKNLYLENPGGTIDFANGAVINGYLEDEHDPGSTITGSGVLAVNAFDTCNDGCYDGGILLHGSRIDGVTVDANVPGFALQLAGVTFGTYPMNVDQLIVHVDTFDVASMNALTFLSQADASHFNIRLIGTGEVNISNGTDGVPGGIRLSDPSRIHFETGSPAETELPLMKRRAKTPAP